MGEVKDRRTHGFHDSGEKIAAEDAGDSADSNDSNSWCIPTMQNLRDGEYVTTPLYLHSKMPNDIKTCRLVLFDSTRRLRMRPCNYKLGTPGMDVQARESPE